MMCIDDDDENVTGESDKIDFAQWSLDYHVEPDDIIRQLVKEANAETDSEAASTSHDATTYVHETDDYAFISHKKDVDNLTGEQSFAAESYHAVASFGNSDMNDDIQDLKRLLDSNPRVYKHCILQIKQFKISASPLDHSVPRIYIQTHDRGRTFHGDDVVVKLLSDAPPQSGSDHCQKVWGKVVGVLKHMIDPKSRLFVCHVDNNSRGLMVPTDWAVPKISNLETRERSLEDRKRKLCVYMITKQRKIRFHHFEPISSTNDSKQFVVKFLSWKEGFRYPLGVVIGTISAGTTAADAMNILNIEYLIPQLYQTATETEVKQLYPPTYKNFPPSAVKGRVDFRRSRVFTIDGPDTTDIDDALSVERRTDGSCTVSIHIANVAYFVERGNSIDKEAGVRGTSHYPAIGLQTNMLPARLSEELCSLIPGVDRLTVTVSAEFDTECDTRSVKVMRSVIQSQHQLTYSLVDDALANVNCPRTECPRPLQCDILMLDKIAKNLRYKRLGESHSSLSAGTRAHVLVEELMIFANRSVAKYLTSVYPSCTPIRVQSAPDSHELESWKEMFAVEQKNMFALSPMLENDGYHSESDDASSSFAVDVLQPLWNAVVSESSEKDVKVEKLFEIFGSPTVHSQLAVASSHLRRIMDRSKFVSSGEVLRKQWHHCSQNLPVYTHFTSPLRRYMDLVVQRMLIAAIEKQPCPYSSREIVDICIRCSDTSVRDSDFEKASKMASLCLQLQERPMCSYAFVEKLSLAKVSLNFPPLKFVLPLSLDVPLSALKVNKAPVIDDGELELRWSQRIYELKPLQTSPHQSSHSLQVDPDQHLVKIAGNSWQRMMTATLKLDAKALLWAVDTAQKSLLSPPSAKPKYAKELTSEGKPVESKKQFCEYSTTLHQSSVLLIQMSVELHRGILRPCIQLLRLTPRTNICIEHSQKPVQCFAAVISHSAVREHYSSAQLYQRLWLPLLRAEAAVAALAESNSAVIRNVKIKWTERDGHHYGTFKISMMFCTERQIKFGKAREVDKSKKTGKRAFEEQQQASPGYLCVQYGCSDLTGMAESLAVLDSDDVCTPHTPAILWVGHCIVTDVFADHKEQCYEVRLRLCYRSSTFPKQLITDGCPLATIEWLPKTFPDV